MKKSVLLALLVLAAAALSGCTHPNDITEDLAQAAVSTDLA